MTRSLLLALVFAATAFADPESDRRLAALRAATAATVFAEPITIPANTVKSVRVVVGKPVMEGDKTSPAFTATFVSDGTNCDITISGLSKGSGAIVLRLSDGSKYTVLIDVPDAPPVGPQPVPLIPSLSPVPIPGPVPPGPVPPAPVPDPTPTPPIPTPPGPTPPAPVAVRLVAVFVEPDAAAVSRRAVLLADPAFRAFRDARGHGVRVVDPQATAADVARFIADVKAGPIALPHVWLVDPSGKVVYHGAAPATAGELQKLMEGMGK